MIDPQKLWSSSQLPTLPSVAIRLLDLSQNPDTEIKDVVDAIKTDPAISAKILKSTNSSFFGVQSKVTSIDRAVPLLGTTVVTSLALSFSLVEAAMTSGPMASHYNAYWLQSVVQGITAELLSEESAKGLDCEYFLTGLLMDLGRLAMLKTIPKEYLPVLERVQNEQRDLHEVESEAFGINHVEVGVKLMENWGLPDTLINSIQYHHTPVSGILEQQGSDDFELIKAISVTAATGDYFCSVNKGAALKRLQELTGAIYNFTDTDLEEFLAKVRLRVDEGGDLFSVNTDELGEPGELMAQASEQLAQLAVREHVAGAQAVARQQAAERETQELATKNQQLQKQAMHDPLTKIYNRQFFNEALQKEISRCCRNAAPIGLIFSDVDKFKRLNDTYGHQFGDLVLQRIAKAFSQVLRSSDTLARYGGEEFVILVNGPTEKGLELVAERVRARIEAEEISFGDQRVAVAVAVTVSVGAAIAVPGRTETNLGERLIAAADEAMYDCKKNGRNQVRLRSLLSQQESRLARGVNRKRFSRWLVNRQVFDIPTASKVLLQCQTERKRIGVLAQEQGYLDAAQVDRILAEQEQTGERFGEIAMRLGLLLEDQLAHLLAMQQEDPLRYAQALIHQGLLDRQGVVSLLKEYITEVTSKPVAQSTAAV